LPDPGVGVDLSIVFGSAGADAAPFTLGTLSPSPLGTALTPVDAIAAAPGVLVGTGRRTLLAVSTGGTVKFGTIDAATFTDLTPGTPVVPGTAQLALSAVADGGAALLVSDGSQITRWDLDVSSGTVAARRGFTGSAGPADTSRSLAYDGRDEIGFVGGAINDLYIFDARLDAGPPRLFDTRQLNPVRLAPPVTGLALYGGGRPLYLLAAHLQGLTIYPLTGAQAPLTVSGILAANPPTGAIRVIAGDAAGQITAPLGVDVTNLDAGAPYYGGVLVLADTNRTFATVRWDLLAQHQVDGGGLQTDSTDPRVEVRVADGGVVDGGPSDGGPDGGLGPGGKPRPPPGPGIPINDEPSSCASVGGSGLVALIALLALLVPVRRQRR
jgi:hypothetical protein